MQEPHSETQRATPIRPGQPHGAPRGVRGGLSAIRTLLGAAVQPDVRIGPPGITSQPESPSMIEQFLMWLQQCISPPIG
jgi:hypothetical protein